MINDILNYWYKIEYFTPCWPVDIKTDFNLNKNDLPWVKEQTNKKVKLTYDLYFGTVKSIALIKWMLSEIKEKEEERIEPDNSNTCIFAFKVDENGYYVPKSFAISGFVWGVCEIVSKGSLKTRLNPKEVEMFEGEIDEQIIKKMEEHKQPIDRKIIKDIFDNVISEIKLPSDFSSMSLWACKKTYNIKKDGRFPEIPSTTELFQSFYLKDIRKVIDNPNQRVSKYILAGVEDDKGKNRISIDSDVQEMKKTLGAECFPLGVWPGTYNPSLMQQIGINICTHGENDIFSINGPPGTGKTTLLKEIVASNIIERARLLIEYDNPDKAFNPVSFQNPCDDFNKKYHRLDSQLKKYGIVVASNNNAAVENISMELPKYITEDRTGRFSKTVNGSLDDIYFTDVASELIGQPAWGLVSAKLGKKENLNKLKERLWWSKDGKTLKRYFREEICDWNLVRSNFKTALQNVLNERVKIAYVQSLQEKEKSLVAVILANLEIYKQIKFQISEKNKSLQYANEKLDKLEVSLKSINDRISFLKSNLCFFMNLFKNNPLVKELKCLKTEKRSVILEICAQKEICAHFEEDINRLKCDYRNYNEVLDNDTKSLENIRNILKLEKIKFKGAYIDDKFWSNITHNKTSQESCPWVYEEYNKLREELFYQALQVNKAFVLLSDSVKKNIQRLFSLWDGKYTVEDRKKSYGDLLNTLLLVIPVVSTTFASVESFLADIDQDELGMLIIDEAGQATPQSALGALWRCKRAIVVGDPLQVEPVLSVPKEIIKCFADEYDIPGQYRIPEISVQMLADSMNKYGGYREVNGEIIWLGCPLVVHRRCLSPMFDISNNVAYNGKMFLIPQSPKEGTVFTLDSSAWFDVKGNENGNKDHTVKNQLEFTKSMFSRFIATNNGFPNLYIITPFKRVAHNLREMMKSVLKQYEYIEREKIDTWVREHCGTVHTFQGKEANEVILVLGCDKQSGKGASQWVGQKPNLINVAVSRAKFRIAVVGDYDLWKGIPNVQVACNLLEVKKGDEFK